MLKLQYFGHLMLRAGTLEKILMLGKIDGKRRGKQMMRWLDSITDSMDMNLSKLWERVEERGAWHAVLHGISESDIETEQQQQIHLLKLIFRAGVQWSLFPYKNGRKMGKKKSQIY